MASAWDRIFMEELQAVIRALRHRWRYFMVCWVKLIGRLLVWKKRTLSPAPPSARQRATPNGLPAIGPAPQECGFATSSESFKLLSLKGKRGWISNGLAP